MKTTRKLRLSLFLIVLALLVLTSCGSKKTQEPSPVSETPIVIYVTPVPTATPAPGTTAVPTATPAGATEAPSPAATQAPLPTPDPTTTPVPTPTPVTSAPVISKSPTDESLTEGDGCMFVARADGADGIAWHFVSPDGATDVEYSSIGDYFPSMGVSGGTETTLQLTGVPADFNGWRVYCRFTNSIGSTSTGSAVVSVAAGATPTPGVIDWTVDYTGTYYETVAGRGEMYIDGSPECYFVTVNWAGSAYESSTWTFSGTFDQNGVLYFSDCSRVTNTYYEDGSSDFTTDYIDASGSLSIVGAGGFLWTIDGDSDVSGSVFE